MKIKPCPFCGGVSCARFVGRSKVEESYFYIQCPYCGARGPLKNIYEDAINVWNWIYVGNPNKGQELKPCPECSCSFVKVMSFHSAFRERSYIVKCLRCGYASSTSSYKSGAIKNWNEG